jgi:hypothetical protein
LKYIYQSLNKNEMIRATAAHPMVNVPSLFVFRGKNGALRYIPIPYQYAAAPTGNHNPPALPRYFRAYYDHHNRAGAGADARCRGEGLAAERAGVVIFGLAFWGEFWYNASWIRIISDIGGWALCKHANSLRKNLARQGAIFLRLLFLLASTLY